jgi:GT2 family glycosyltransferase
MEVSPEVTAVVPTLGGPGLGRALASLRRQGGGLEVTVVHQGSAPLPEEVAALADRVLAFDAPLGYAAAANAGIAVRRRRHVLLLNDDAELLPGWLAAARAVLDSSATVAAVQGVNLAAADGEARVEGCGLGWNRWWQAVQLGAGRAAPPPAGGREVFGASAAAVLLRSSALAAVALPGGVFDPGLHTYYEDVDLAGRLRGAGYQAAVATAARARHLGGGSAATLGRRRLALLYGNRWLVLARLLGDALPARVPRVLLRDLLDAARRPARLAAALAGWARAGRSWDRFARPGPPLVPLAELRRLAAERFG